MIPQKISARFLMLFTVFFILISVIVAFLVNTQMRKHALVEAESKARLLLDRSLATHTYFNHQLKPELFKITDGIKPKTYFDPVWMSSTYAIREIQKYFKSLSDSEFYYKECAINARSPENEADAFEKAFIQELNTNKNLNVKSIERKINGLPYFQILRRGEAMEGSCLRCHSTPSNAPEDLIKQYGPERSFDRSIGEVVSAISIRIPLAAAYVNANQFSVTLSLSLLFLLFILYLVTGLTARYMIFRPLDAIRQKTSEIISNPKLLGNQIPLPHGKELKDLTSAFNQLSMELRKERDDLETKIKEKTAHLEKEIDERKRSENAVRQSEVKYRQLFENMMNGFALHEIICDEKGQPVNYRFLNVNPAFERLTGLKSKTLIGKTVLEVMPNTETFWIEKYGHVAATGEPIEFENYSQELDRYFHVTAFRPAPKQFACIFQDITEIKQAREDLRRAQKMQALGTLTGGIAHEFNNILGIILGNVELAAEDIPKENPAAAYIEEIQIASLRARDVVQKLMIAAQKKPTAKKPIQISTTIKSSLDLLRKTIPANIDIRSHIDCTNETILADPNEINQLLINLCANSVHAMKKETGVLEVRLETITMELCSSDKFKGLQPGDYVRLTVADKGEGIDPGIMERIFDPYFTTKDVDEGLGMGLAVVQGIVKNHNGAIHIESQIGKGSTVEVLFPLIETQVKESGEKPETLPTGTERILFVDDEAALVKLFLQVLARFGYNVVGKTSSTDALKIFKENPDQFDLVISDMSMPDMPGDQLASKIIGIRPDIPIILCTGHSNRIDESRARKIGVKAVINKPLSKMDLAETVRKVLDGKNEKLKIENEK